MWPTWHYLLGCVMRKVTDPVMIWKLDIFNNFDCSWYQVTQLKKEWITKYNTCLWPTWQVFRHRYFKNHWRYAGKTLCSVQTYVAEILWTLGTIKSKYSVDSKTFYAFFVTDVTLSSGACFEKYALFSHNSEVPQFLSLEFTLDTYS